MTAPLRSALAPLGLALALALSGCGGDSRAETSVPAPELISPDTLSVCSDMPYAPFESQVKGKPVGFDIDLVNLVADRLKVEVSVRDTEFDKLASGESLEKGECDLVISAMTITGERARVLDFSSPYFDAAQALVVPQGSEIEDLDGLAGKRVAVQAGTTGEVYLTDRAPAETTQVPLADVAAVNKALVEGRADAAFYDNTIVGTFLAARPDMRVAAEFDTGEQYGMAVRKDANADLLRVVNDVLAEARTDGTYDTIYAKWFRSATS